MYSIGIDIGYSTLNSIVLDSEKNKVFKNNVFHHGNISTLLKIELENIREKFNIEACYIGFTGEQGKLFKRYHINDISALIEGSVYTKENIKTIIEIGAQSSRYITGFEKNSRTNIKISSNSSCSAGTGSFLEEQVSRLGIDLDEYASYVERATKIPRIAGRCSVFSKTDMIHHQQEGVEIEDILLGLSYALVRNYKANVVQRIKVERPVIFIGGVAKNQGVVKALKDIFQFSKGDIFIPDDCMNIGALGAALAANSNQTSYKLKDIFKDINEMQSRARNLLPYKPLGKYGNKDSKDKHICKAIKAGAVEGYLGIDIGSTSTNFVLIDGNKDVLAYRYLKTKGNPKRASELGMESIQNEFKNRLIIKGIATTGSGRNMIGKKLKADLIVNEITAQAKGAAELDKDVDTIFEIGGQDSKYIRIKDGRVIDFEMNKICAAGTGSFIEEQAKKLGIPIEEYENAALKGDKPLNLGDRCTVFIEGNISKAIAEGSCKEDITAGLSYSIVSNYLNRVVGNKSIGNKIFLQGGIAHNQAVINAFRSVLGKAVIVPPFFSVTGAYGAAVLAKEEIENKRDKKIIKDTTRDVESEIESLFLKGYTSEADKDRLTIGIPRVLFLHKLFPMFNKFFKELGFNVILSEATNKEIIALSQEYSLDETCYPIKLINGHVAKLINKGVDYIFLPSLYTMKHEVSKTREDYACVYMQTAPRIVSYVMDLEAKGIKLLSPALSFKFGKKYMMETLMKLGKELGKNRVQTTLALTKGMKRLKQFQKEVEDLGKEIIDNLKEEEKAFVIITRAYGIADKGLNMEIPKKLREMGHKVLTLSNLPAHDYDISEDYPNMYWPFGQHILSGSKIVKESKNLYAIYLTNHGCGPDTMLSHYFKEEMKGKPYLHIEVDEHSSNVGVMTRLEAFIDSLKTSKDNGGKKREDNDIKNNIKPREAIRYIPYLYPYSHILEGIFKRKGINAKILPPTSEESIEIGKKYSISKEYLSLTALLGDIFSNIEEMKTKKASIWLPKNEGSETSGQYSRLLEQKIKLAGYEYIKVESPFIEDILEDEKYGIDFGLALIAGDIIMASKKEIRSDNLKVVLENIEAGNFNEELLTKMADYTYKQLGKKDYEKSIYVLGEPQIIFNPILNNYQLEKLEEKNRVSYMPLSEMMYFKWTDYLKKEKSPHGLLKKNLLQIKSIICNVSKALKEHSPFDNALDEMIKMADSKLPIYSGGNGRYRMIKQFRCPAKTNGLLVFSSMYENTGTIIKLLKDKHEKEFMYPIIELSFDGSKHSGNDERIQNFIYYI